MDPSTLVIRGAREHNLQNVHLELPRNQLIVFTGVSGSGKSSLAFDTLYAEGQRRYVESLSAYARQFLGQLPKPDVDFLGGLSPTISIQQKTGGKNPRSTVGTITEIHDYLRVLFARIGKGHCPECGRPISAQSREQILAQLLALPKGTSFLVLAPVIRGQKGEYKDLFQDMLRRGYIRARVDGQVVRLTEDLKLDRRIKHNIEIVIDRLQIGDSRDNSSAGPGTAASKTKSSFRTRLADAVEQALALGKGTIIIAIEGGELRIADCGLRIEEREGKVAEEGSSEPSITVPQSASRKPQSKNPQSASRKPQSEDLLLSAHYACTHCNRSYETPSPQLFSFNSPQGMCPDCDGLGARYTFAPDLLIPDPSLSFFNGAIPLVGPLRGMGRWRRHIYEGVAQTLGIDLKTPWQDLPQQHKDYLLYGSGDRHITFVWKMRGGSVWKHGDTWEGIVPQLISSFKKTAAGPRRLQLEKYMRVLPCNSCQGQRLNPQARAVRVGSKTLVEVCAMPIGDLADWLDPSPPLAPPYEGGDGGVRERDPLEKSLEPVQKTIAAEVLKEIRARLNFLLYVGLHYLSLDRAAPTLSGGEAQRIRLAGQIGSGLVGVLYILDEPSIGLHPRDNQRLLESLQRLRDMGNTVLVVEHDEETMRAADYLVDFGPGPGVRGGQVVAAGSLAEVVANPASLTGQYLAGTQAIPSPPQRRPRTDKVLTIHGARHNNLQNLTVDIPLGLFVCVTGVSGSGKSSLINDILKEGLKQLQSADCRVQIAEENESNGSEICNLQAAICNRFDRITGTEHIDKIIDIDQSPIGRTPRSNPATYIKVFDEIRSLYAEMAQAKVRGYQPGRFSFNKPGGRCEACEGNGSNRLEMDFLADIWVPCPVCEGRRFNRETLQIRFKDKTIRDVLEMDVQEALEHFANVPKIRAMLQTLHDVGLDYIKLGQPSPTLSGGEAQRIKLARELCRRSTGKTLYLLDEPTTGLHFDDIRKLLQVLHGFVDAGNTVIVIEHNLDIIKTADWIIDLGPDGGAGGGKVVCTGTPEEVAGSAESYTGQALRKLQIADFRLQIAKNGSGSNSKSAICNLQSAISTVAVQGAQQHNLKNIDVTLPRERLTVCCGPSGSGKTSLALDTIYAEGQRRYVESLSAYARQFLGQIQKPKFEHISGLSPAISIEQQNTSKSPRSTVGTVTEIYDYLRILYARLGHPYCPACGIAIGTQTADEIIDKVQSLPEGTRLYVMAPVERRGQEKYQVLWEELRRTGFLRMRVDGRSYSVEEPPAIDHRRKHQIEVIVDRLAVRPAQRGRLADAVEAALELGRGVVHVTHVDDQRPEPKWKVERFSQHLACDRCGRSFEPLNPHHFSFNSPLGWCPTCEGLGGQLGANPTFLLRDPQRSLRQGALAPWPLLTDDCPFLVFAQALADHLGLSLDTPFAQLTAQQQQALLHGTGEDWIALTPEKKRSTQRKQVHTSQGQRPPDSANPPPVRFQYKGIVPALNEASRVSFTYRHQLDQFVSEVACAACGGSRLRDDAAACRFQGHTLGEVCQWPLAKTLAFFQNLKLPREQKQVAGDLLREITNRLQFLVDVGLDYLTLSRPAPTLSGGEAQRIRLASQIGSGLTGVLYVLDEPTIGLHPRDNRRLLKALTNLRNLGNTLIVVEHDREVTAQGSLKQLQKTKTSLTGQYLSGRRAIPIPTNRRLQENFGLRITNCGLQKQSETRYPIPDTRYPIPDTRYPIPEMLIVKGARQNNLKNIDVALPLGAFIAVTGVSGSGKSSLVHEILFNALARKLHRAKTVVGAHDDLLGVENIDKVINVDQSPLGNTPSSNPATYTGLFDLVRQLFAQLPEARVRGYQAKRFSFNKPGGRCEACEGNGQKKIEMHFLPDVWIECDVCRGQRYNPETLAVQYKGKSIADVLNLRVSQALELFANIPKIRRILQTLADVGLDYIALGQPAPTLSGGEAQRVKLAAELARPNTGRTLYLLDEPTTGLHFDDIRKLLDVLQRLVDLGNTVIVIEHNLDVIKTADWVIDLGPEAGADGGYVVAQGTPEQVVTEHTQQPTSRQPPPPFPPLSKGGKGGVSLPGSGIGIKTNGLLSYTAGFLASALEAGPYAERPRYQPPNAATQSNVSPSSTGFQPVAPPETGEPEDEESPLILSEAEQAAMPWETDGIRWHTQERLSHNGRPCRWEGKILTWIDEQIHARGAFSPTNWKQPTIVEIAATKKNQGWFFHAHSAMEWVVRLVFRVGRNTFKSDDLNRRLGIPTLNDTPGVEAYSDEPRARVANRKGPWQEVIIMAHRLTEIDTPAFHDFLTQAVQAFQRTLQRMTTKPEDLMPWKVNGQRWHLGDKGFPPGRKIAWDRALLPRLLEIAREVEPKIEIAWDNRLSINLYVPGITRAWSQWRTKLAEGLVCRFLGKRGQFNLGRIEKFGSQPQVLNQTEGDILLLTFLHADHLHAADLKELLREHLQGFREVFGKKE